MSIQNVENSWKLFKSPDNFCPFFASNTYVANVYSELRFVAKTLCFRKSRSYLQDIEQTIFAIRNGSINSTIVTKESTYCQADYQDSVQLWNSEQIRVFTQQAY